MAAISKLVFGDGCFQQIIRPLPDGLLCFQNSKCENYFLSGNKSKIDTQVTGNRRRAAPLVAHVHQFRDGFCLLVLTLLQSLFLPPGLKMEIKANRTTKKLPWIPSGR